jgi:hypothetical protein
MGPASDTHIKNLKNHDEYRTIFNKMYELLAGIFTISGMKVDLKVGILAGYHNGITEGCEHLCGLSCIRIALKHRIYAVACFRIISGGSAAASFPGNPFWNY